MVNQFGSQIREKIENSEYVIDVIATRNIAEAGEIILKASDGRLELWAQNDDYAGYVIEISDIGYEFIRGVKR